MPSHSIGLIIMGRGKFTLVVYILNGSRKLSLFLLSFWLLGVYHAVFAYIFVISFYSTSGHMAATSNRRGLVCYFGLAPKAILWSALPERIQYRLILLNVCGSLTMRT